MPEIKISCFQEYINVHLQDGTAYPFHVGGTPKNRIIKPANKEGIALDDS